MKRIISLFTVVFIAVFSVFNTAAAQGNSVLPSEVMSANVYNASNGIMLPYRLYVPQEYTSDKEYSFLLFLHGAGNRGDDNLNQISENTGLIERIIGGEKVTYGNESIDTSKEFIIVAPQCGKDYQWVDTPWGKSPDPSYSTDEIPESKYMAALNELLDELFVKYNIDEQRQYVTGLSMGGFGTWDLLVRQPDRWAAAIPMGGAADVDKAELIKDIPIWTFHQILDSVVLSEGTQRIVARLAQLGGNIKFTPYFDLQHNAWTKGYAEEDLLEWLYSQKRSDEEVKIAFVGDSITYGAELKDRDTESFPALIKEKLKGNAVVENFGVSARSALKSAKYPYTDTEEYKKSLEFNPDILFVMLGTNDIKTENWTDGAVNYEKDYIDLIESYKSLNPNLKIYLGIPPRIFKDNVYGERSTTVLENEGFPKMYAVAEKVGAEIVDIFSETLPYEEYFPDFLHPDERGHKIIAELVYEKMAPYFNKNEINKAPFDTASDWAKKELSLASAIGLMPEIVTEDLQKNITREEFCESVIKIIPKSTEGYRTAHFTDTDNEFINRAYSVGVVNGVSEDCFNPDSFITREEICAMLHRAYKITVSDASFEKESVIPDLEDISDWAKDSVSFMNKAGIVLGDENGMIKPLDYTSREQGIALVYRTFISAGCYGKIKAQ